MFYGHKGRYSVGKDDLGYGNSGNLTDDQKETVDIVLKEYGDMDPYELRELNHSEKLWKDARGTLPDTAPCSNVITKDSMGLYYGSL